MAQAGADCVFWVRRQLEDTKKIVSRKEEAALRAYLLLQLHDGSKAVSIRDVRANSVPKDEPAYRELRKKWC